MEYPQTQNSISALFEIDLLCLILSFLNYDDIFLSYGRNLFLVCQFWCRLIKNINKMVDILQPNGCMYRDLLRFTNLIPTVKTVGKFDFNSRYSSNYSYYIDTFLKTYHPILWRNLEKPNLQDIIKYLRNSQNRYSNYGKIFSNIAIVGKKSSFTYIYSLYKTNNVEFEFENDLFDLLCQSHRKFGVSFIRWILRERPKSIIITISGITELITYGFPDKYIRSVISNYQKYNIKFTYDEQSRKATQIEGDVCEQLVYEALKSYHWKMVSGDLSDVIYKEISFYLRMVSDDRIKYLLIWTLNGRNRKQVDFIERVIADNIDVKPYTFYYCWQWYQTTLPYELIKDTVQCSLE